MKSPRIVFTDLENIEESRAALNILLNAEPNNEAAQQMSKELAEVEKDITDKVYYLPIPSDLIAKINSCFMWLHEEHSDLIDIKELCRISRQLEGDYSKQQKLLKMEDSDE